MRGTSPANLRNTIGMRVALRRARRCLAFSHPLRGARAAKSDRHDERRAECFSPRPLGSGRSEGNPQTALEVFAMSFVRRPLLPVLVALFVALFASPSHALICGDLILDPGETCDDGNLI